jgi:putative ATP-dependent endonuclease of the OLD family
MRLHKLEIDNYRSFSQFALNAGGNSLFLVSENGVGKTALLVAVAKALGKDRSPTVKSDFADATLPIEIIATLGDFAPEDQGAFPGLLNFSGKPTLRIGFRAEWNEDEQEVDAFVGFPDAAWKKASRDQREAIPLVWLPAWRDPARALLLGNASGLLGGRLRDLNLTGETENALQAIGSACDTFRSAPELSTLLKTARDDLARLIPSVSADALTLGTSAASERDLLRQFELLMAHPGEALPIGRQSTGLAHLALFAFAIETMAATPKAIVLIDEPEVSLHPQAQRALTGVLRGHSNQSLVATHSSNVLDRADPRTIVRLARIPAVEAIHASTLSDSDAKWLQRFANAQTAEAFFARNVVLVEGYSDRLALLTLARRKERDLDAEGTTVLSLEGGSGVGAFISLLGPNGLRLAVSGFCDSDKESKWIGALAAAGAKVTNRVELNALGFFVCERDLEDELVKALGVSSAQSLIAKEGEAKAFQKFVTQPAYASMTTEDQLRKFFQKDKVRWTPLLVEALDLSTFKGALGDAISHV